MNIFTWTWIMIGCGSIVYIIPYLIKNIKEDKDETQ